MPLECLCAKFQRLDQFRWHLFVDSVWLFACNRWQSSWSNLTLNSFRVSYQYRAVHCFDSASLLEFDFGFSYSQNYVIQNYISFYTPIGSDDQHWFKPKLPLIGLNALYSDAWSLISSSVVCSAIICWCWCRWCCCCFVLSIKNVLDNRISACNCLGVKNIFTAPSCSSNCTFGPCTETACYKLIWEICINILLDHLIRNRKQKLKAAAAMYSAYLNGYFNVRFAIEAGDL